MWNVWPEMGAQVTFTDVSTVSVAAGSVYATTAPCGEVAATDRSGGALVKTGGVVSATRTLKRSLELRPDASVAVHTPCVRPSGSVLPDAGRQVTATGLPLPSVAV